VPAGYHVVCDGREVFVRVDEDDLTRLARGRGRFQNTLQSASLARIGLLVRLAGTFEGELRTDELVARAEIEADRKGAMGALRMLDVQGVIHARAGRGRQLVWYSGPRSEGSVPKGVDHGRYLLLRELLRGSTARWHATDWLVREAGFDRSLDYRIREDLVGRRPRIQRGLPENFFVDNGKSARKYVLGALKVLYWMESVAWRNHTRQAVEWKWIAPVTGGVGVPLLILPAPKGDPYLEENVPQDRLVRVWEAAFQRELEFEEKSQRWIAEHYPAEAAAFQLKRHQRERERAQASKQKRREAKRWLAG
jgi:hypothetical protein